MEEEVLEKYKLEENNLGAYQGRGEPLKGQIKQRRNRDTNPGSGERIVGLGSSRVQRILGVSLVRTFSNA